MYKKIIKPLLLALNVEQVNAIVILALRILGAIPGVRSLLRMSYREDHESLSRDVFGLNFKNPIGLAPGFDTNGEIVGEMESMGFGFVEIGAVTPKPQIGNPKPRLFALEGDRALINRMGQPNKGLEYVAKKLRTRRTKGMIVGCNISRNSYSPAAEIPKEYLKIFRSLYQYVDYFTVNVISSNSATDGVVFEEEALRRIISPLFEFRRGQSDYRPILVKISADLTDEQIDTVTDIMIDTPLDGVVAVSGSLKREGLLSDSAVVTRIGSGRLSGEPIKERALEVVRRVHDRCHGAYPIIGVGGISTAEDAGAMLDAGASLVQIYSGFVFEGPKLVKNICKSLIKE
ncbi:MAG: quinone-dependent dihydroorotate dehydrogenase [Rikenellaceae bacterium]